MYIMYIWTVVLEKTLESSLDCKEIKPVNSKGNQCLIFIGRTDAEPDSNILATWSKELTRWKRLWCWKRLKAGEGDDRGWDGWMALPTRWTWVWASCESWRWTGKPGVLQSMGSQRVRHAWETELNWGILYIRGIDFDYCDVEWLTLDMNLDHSVIFEVATKYDISDSFIDYEGYSISSLGFLPTEVDKIVI